MADKNVQLKDRSGNNLFPKVKTSNVTNDANFITQSELTAAINASSHLKKEIATSLPESDIDANTIYMILKSPAGESGDVYDEYMYLNSAWEKIGSSAVNLTNYYTKTEVDASLALKAPLDSPALTGTPTCPTPATDSGIANKGYVDNAVTIVYTEIV